VTVAFRQCDLSFLNIREILFGETKEDQFMFGPEVLVAPVLIEGSRQRKV
jgi:hypothetical protein